ncbi:hypothetical protein BAL199_02849 [alpha proteobacterium BAL199]|nr:hypothetical protein BAL199_02849 [alpha proteobacterium BAL199]
MSGYVETFRSNVFPWETDVVEHFTVAYYYEKFAAAGDRALLALGQDPAATHTVDWHTRYQRELRAGDSYHVMSAPISAEDGDLVIGHKLYDSADGTLCATTEQTVLGASASPDALVVWDGPEREVRPAPAWGPAWVRSATDLVIPRDLDRSGRMGVDAMIHRFSAAIAQVLVQAGMTPSYLREKRIGYSTFEFQLRVAERPVLGEPVDCHSCFAQIGRSSMRMVHRLTRPTDDAVVAELSQFGVHLDLDARRPSSIPPDLVERARQMLASTD